MAELYIHAHIHTCVKNVDDCWWCICLQCVCVYVFVCVCMSAHVYIYIYTHARARAHTDTKTWMVVYRVSAYGMHVYMCECVYVCVYKALI